MFSSHTPDLLIEALGGHQQCAPCPPTTLCAHLGTHESHPQQHTLLGGLQVGNTAGTCTTFPDVDLETFLFLRCTTGFSSPSLALLPGRLDLRKSSSPDTPPPAPAESPISHGPQAAAQFLLSAEVCHWDSNR